MVSFLQFLKTIDIKKREKVKNQSWSRLKDTIKKVKTFIDKLKRGNLKVVINCSNYRAEVKETRSIKQGEIM